MSEFSKINDFHIRSMKRLYVAGPFTGRSPWETYRNMLEAEKISAEIWRKCPGAVSIFIPHTNAGNMVGNNPERDMILSGLSMLDVCDVVFFMPGWVSSKGSKGEILRAVEVRKDMFFDKSELILYLNNGDAAMEEQDKKWNRCMCCGPKFDSSNWCWGTPYGICDDCLSMAWPGARYHPAGFEKILKEKGLIHDS